MTNNGRGEKGEDGEGAAKAKQAKAGWKESEKAAKTAIAEWMPAEVHAVVRNCARQDPMGRKEPKQGGANKDRDTGGSSTKAGEDKQRAEEDKDTGLNEEDIERFIRELPSSGKKKEGRSGKHEISNQPLKHKPNKIALSTPAQMLDDESNLGRHGVEEAEESRNAAEDPERSKEEPKLEESLGGNKRGRITMSGREVRKLNM